jgi:predicted RNA methylase
MSKSKKVGLKRFKNNQYDQFYTRTNVSEDCINKLKLNINDFDIVIEPSAGTGSFNKAFKKKFPNYTGKFISYDIDPKYDGIIEQDYLKLDISDFKDKKVLVLGNPPFGRNSSLAKKFIKKSCKFADTIAFILSASFKKESMNKSFDLNFHCIQEFDIEPNAFIVGDKEHNVDCVFQVWKKEKTKRKLKPRKYISDKFKYVKKKSKNADFVFRRVGVKAGTASRDFDSSPQSNHFIKLNKSVSKTDIDNIIEQINNADWNNNMNYKSISKPEINQKLEEIIN